MPHGLRDHLEQRAKTGSRSLHAEIISRLEETLEIEKALAEIAPGAPISGTAGLLIDIADELDELKN